MTSAATTRVAITGIGCVTPWGVGVDAAREGFERGRDASWPAVSPLRELGVERTAAWPSMDPRPAFRATKALKLAHPAAQAAVLAAREALAGDPPSGRGGVAVGITGGDLQVDELLGAIRSLDEREASDPVRFGDAVMQDLPPLWLLRSLPNLVSAHVAIQVDADGPNTTLMTEGAAGLQAIHEAARWIAREEAAWALAGAAECGVLPFAAVAAGGDDRARGLVPADAAVMLRLEPAADGRRSFGVVSSLHEGLLDGPGDAEAWLAGLPPLDADWTIALALAPGATGQRLGTALRRRATGAHVVDLAPFIGHAGAALAPAGLALALLDRSARPILAVALGASGLATALVVARTQEYD
jgi:hypothetical protein